MRASLVLILLLGLGGPAAARAASPSETALLALWKIHAAASNDHAAARAACRLFLDGRHDDPYAPVGLGIDAWHALCARQTGDAAAIFTNMLACGAGPVGDAARAMAERWLADRFNRKTAAKIMHKFRKICIPGIHAGNAINHHAINCDEIQLFWLDSVLHVPIT